MSSPQRQVGSRRLPPLPKVAPSTYIKTGKNETTKTASNGRLALELSNDLLEGPFRPALTPESFAQLLSSGGKAMGYDIKSQVDSKEMLIPGTKIR